MLTAEERQLRIDQIRRLPGELRAALDHLNDAQLDTPYRVGGWTVRQVVHHLADSHMHAYLRMKLIVAEENPAIKPYNQDVWAAMEDGRAGSLLCSLTLLEGLHARWAMFLDHLPVEAWARTAFHPERGAVTLESMVKTYSDHGRKHIGQITALRTSKGW